ncbi:MAG: serine/threonine protein kinase [Planctomycetota bacterium]|nr:serine/threonine protein kinase [Planctomycetota bacterium]
MASTDLKPDSNSQTSLVCAPRVAGYTLLDKRYESSVCSIYKARQERLGRVVCLKLLPEFPPPCDVALERFNRAAYVSAQVVHQNLPVLYETGTSDGYHYTALEYVSGSSLQDILVERGRLSERRAVWVGLQVARALVALHEKQIVHRNVKPKNILVESTGRVRLVGLGLAKCEAACFSKHLDTQTIGTPHYMAPEMIRGRYTDPRSDLYSLGITMYVMASGAPPFPKGMPAAVMAKHLYEAPPPLRERYPELSREFAETVDDLLIKNPDERISSAREAVRRLERLAARHNYDDLCFADAPRAIRDKRAPLDWNELLRPLAIFFGSLASVFVGGILLFAAYQALSAPAVPAPPAAPAAAPKATQPAPAAQPAEAAPVPDPLAEKRAAEFQRLKELESVFRRDPWRGVMEWDRFLALFPEAPVAMKQDAERRSKIFHKLAADQAIGRNGLPRADNAGEALDF